MARRHSRLDADTYQDGDDGTHHVEKCYGYELVLTD